MEFLLANWGWMSPLAVPAILAMLKIAAKLTPWDGDDKILTLLKGLWDISRGKKPKG